MPEHLHLPANRAQGWAMMAVSAVNGFFGDLLHDRQNGLAIDMAFYDRKRPLPLRRENLLNLQPPPTGQLCVFVHGLACHEGVWMFPDPADAQRETSYGAQLHADLGYTALYLRYNTGLPIGINGKRLALLLNDLLACYPLPVEELVLIGHSMGGLVLRSACHYGAEQRLAWTAQVSQVFYLGTPHDGADLERFAYGATTVLEAVPHPITQIIGRFLNQRSQGVKDLRHGTVLAPDAPVGAGTAQQRRDIPWLAAAEHLVIAGALTQDPEHIAAVLFGDGLVALPPYTATPKPAEGRSSIPPTRVRVFPRVNHLKLTRDPDVYQQIRAWCADRPKE